MQTKTLTDRKSTGSAILGKERAYISSYAGPSGFHWLVNGLMGGMHLPGVLTEMRYDIEALQRMNASLLVTLNEVWAPPVEALAAAGIDSLTHKIKDLHAPDFESALKTCQIVDAYLLEDKVCIYHCRAGMGRTGTLLAAQLIYYGHTAKEAVKTARAQNKRWVETDKQMIFLHEFDLWLNGARG